MASREPESYRRHEPSWRDMGIFLSHRTESGVPVTDERSYGRRRNGRNDRNSRNGRNGRKGRK
eukprot:2789540-Prymnesium_polylepis.1